MIPSQRTGIRLILIALVLAAITSVAFGLIRFVPPALYLSDPGTAYTFHVLVLPLASTGLTLFIAGTGFSGILLVEQSRGRTVGAGGTSLDRIRIAILAAAIGAAFIFVSGYILAFVHISDVVPWESTRRLAILGILVATGFVLFWSARRMNPAAGPLATLALATGVLSGAVDEGTSLTLSWAGIVNDAPFVAVLQTIEVVVFLAGLGSLIFWTLVFVRIAGRLPPAVHAVAASKAELTL